jgi:L-fuconolactonase
VLVQAAPTEAETAFMLALAAQHPWVAGVVGWVDLTAADAPQRLGHLATSAKLRGIRPMLQDLADDEWLLTGPVPRAWTAMAALQLRLDALVNTRHLGALDAFARRHTELQVVVDHAAKPPLREGWESPAMAAWRGGMRRLALLPNVHCKFSGLLTEAAPGDVASVDAALAVVRPVWGFLLEAFGAGRLMWGSDWPVLTLAGPYDLWASICTVLVGELAPPEQAQIWLENAVAFYGLNVP